jgi:hypothetical protein
MRKIITLSAIAILATAIYADDNNVTTATNEINATTATNETPAMSTQSQIDALKAQIEQLQKTQDEKIAKLEKKTAHNTKKISHVNVLANNDNLKFSADLRTSYDYISYKNAVGDTASNGIFSNRLWLKMAYAPTEHLAFYGTIAYNKMYGQTTAPSQGFNYSDSVVNETVNDTNELRIKEAYWLYKNDTFLGMDVPWTASMGRRPSTDGLLVNYREDQKAKSAIGHNINMEFDGASFNYVLENVTGVPGMSLKFCLGRGMSNVSARYSGIEQQSDGTFKISPTYNYTKVDGYSNTDLAGILFNPYDDGQYSLHTVWFRAYNLPGMVATATPGTYDYKQTGDETGGAASFVADGIGDGISDMLDDTVFFASFAYSKTHPENAMLGSSESQTGTSVYVGANWPCQLIDDARVGIEYNHGSQYWRSFTYGEDTLAGSKLAVRGDAYEMWFNKELIGRKLTAQIRYTYMDYKYTGSDGFFGDAGAPREISAATTPNAIDVAQDIRVYVRYRY